jgi:hypothetical protein
VTTKEEEKGLSACGTRASPNKICRLTANHIAIEQRRAAESGEPAVREGEAKPRGKA